MKRESRMIYGGAYFGAPPFRCVVVATLTSLYIFNHVLHTFKPIIIEFYQLSSADCMHLKYVVINKPNEH